MFNTVRLTECTDKGKGCKINFDQICGSHDWLNMLADQSLRQPTIEYVDSGYSFERCPLHSMTNCMTCAVQRLLHLANCCFSDVSNQKVGYSTATQYECSVTRSTNSSAAMTTWQRATAVHVQTAWPCFARQTQCSTWCQQLDNISMPAQDTQHFHWPCMSSHANTATCNVEAQNVRVPVRNSMAAP